MEDGGDGGAYPGGGGEGDGDSDEDGGVECKDGANGGAAQDVDPEYGGGVEEEHEEDGEED